MFANFLIGLREGLEAALIIAILVAYVVKVDQRQLLPRLWAGVIAAIALSFIAGAALTLTSTSFSGRAEPTFSGIMSLAAVGLITWMIFWMARNARAIKGHLHGEVDKALARSSWALAIVAFVAVAREGLETSLFIWAGISSSGQEVGPLIGALVGLIAAAVIGLLLYRGALRLDLARMFFWTGIALVVIAGGVLRYAIAELQEAAFLPGAGANAFDLSGAIDSEGGIATAFRAIFNLTPTMTWLEVFGWLAYVVIVTVLFVRTVRKSGPKPVAASTVVPVSV